MGSVQRAIIPSVFFGVIIIFWLTGLAVREDIPVDKPAQAAAQTVQPETIQSVEKAIASKNSESCGIIPNYPESVRAWCSLIEKYSKLNRLSPDLVAAVILQESGGNARAYSKSGAVGLMQVMPRDGLAASFSCSGKPCFSNRPSMAELYDPEFNISYGSRMLAGLIQKHGTIRDALKAYGPINYGYKYADIVIAIMNRYR